MNEVERNAIEGRALLLYDGVCALCNGMVKFLMKRDRGERFRFAPLQSELGRELLARFDIHTFPDGVVLIIEALTPAERIYRRSDAVQESLQQLGAPWKQMGKAPTPVDLASMWKSLGISQVGGKMVYDDAAPLAGVRRGILSGKAR